MHFQKIGIKSGLYFRKIGIKSGIHFGNFGIRNGYVFETSMARPRPKFGQVPPPPGDRFQTCSLFCSQRRFQIATSSRHPKASTTDKNENRSIRSLKSSFSNLILSTQMYASCYID